MLYYSGEMFIARGEDIAKIGTAFVGIAQFLFGLISTFTVDQCGRKFILILGSILCAMCLFLFGYAYNLHHSSEQIFLFLYIAAFSFSHGPIWYLI